MGLEPRARIEVYKWRHRRGFRDWLLAIASVFGLFYVIFPAFYLLTRAVQERLIHPPFAAVEREFLQFLMSVIPRYHTLVFEGDTFLLFTRLEPAYRPNVGVGEVWTRNILPFLPYAFYGLGIFFIFRVGLPWVFSFEQRSVWWRLLTLFLVGNVLNEDGRT